MVSTAASSASAIHRYRFSVEEAQLGLMLEDELLARHLRDQRAIESRRSMRRELLANAVRIDQHTLPGLASMLTDIAARAGLERELEAFVFADPAVQAFVVDGSSHMLIGLSSGAVETLQPEELAFVIGHEIGHAVCGHVNYVTGCATEGSGLPPRAAMRVMAWSRACEISADRVGLICCGSLQVAANALFRCASGLKSVATISARAFAAQWDHLLAEVIQRGTRDHWGNSHPYPPLRVMALLAFVDAQGSPDAIPKAEQQRVDQEIARMLAVMDPVAREDREVGDPTLTELLSGAGSSLPSANVSQQRRTWTCSCGSRRVQPSRRPWPARTTPTRVCNSSGTPCKHATGAYAASRATGCSRN